MATEAMRRKCAEATRVMAAHDDDHVEDDDDDHHVEDDDDAFFMNPHAEEAHGGNDDDDDDDDDDDGEIYFTGKRCSGRSLARHRWWYLSVHYQTRLLRLLRLQRRQGVTGKAWATTEAMCHGKSYSTQATTGNH